VEPVALPLFSEGTSSNPLFFMEEILLKFLGDVDADQSSASLSNTAAPTVSKKKTLATDAFVQLVHAASQNKERVANYKDANKSKDI
jgi:hypothetical protein